MDLVKIIIAIGIAVVIALFIGYGTYTLYEPPKNQYAYNNCYQKFSCDSQMSDCYKQKMYEDCTATVRLSSAYLNCKNDLDKCNLEYEESNPQTIYFRNLTWIFLLFGLALLLVGGFVTIAEAVNSGLIGGGLLLILSGTFNLLFLSKVTKYIQLIIIACVLALLLYLGYKQMGKKEEIEILPEKKKG